MKQACKDCVYWELIDNLPGVGTCEYFLWRRGGDMFFNDAPFWARGLSKYTDFGDGEYCQGYKPK